MYVFSNAIEKKSISEEERNSGEADHRRCPKKKKISKRLVRACYITRQLPKRARRTVRLGGRIACGGPGGAGWVPAAHPFPFSSFSPAQKNESRGQLAKKPCWQLAFKRVFSVPTMLHHTLYFLFSFFFWVRLACQIWAVNRDARTHALASRAPFEPQTPLSSVLQQKYKKRETRNGRARRCTCRSPPRRRDSRLFCRPRPAECVFRSVALHWKQDTPRHARQCLAAQRVQAHIWSVSGKKKEKKTPSAGPWNAKKGKTRHCIFFLLLASRRRSAAVSNAKLQPERHFNRHEKKKKSQSRDVIYLHFFWWSVFLR